MFCTTERLSFFICTSSYIECQLKNFFKFLVMTSMTYQMHLNTVIRYSQFYITQVQRHTLFSSSSVLRPQRWTRSPDKSYYFHHPILACAVFCAWMMPYPLRWNPYHNQNPSQMLTSTWRLPWFPQWRPSLPARNTSAIAFCCRDPLSCSKLT